MGIMHGVKSMRSLEGVWRLQAKHYCRLMQVNVKSEKNAFIELVQIDKVQTSIPRVSSCGAWWQTEA